MNREFLFAQNLKPCPLCGRAEAETVSDCWRQVYMTAEDEPGPWGIGPAKTMYHIRCGSCLLKLSRATAEAAREAWNQRADTVQA